MKYTVVLGIYAFLLFQPTQAMLTQQQGKKNTERYITFHCYLELLPITVQGYNKAKTLINTQKIFFNEKKFKLPLNGQQYNTIQLDLPTSPNHVSFDVKSHNNPGGVALADNPIHYEDTIVIKDNCKSIILFNESTGRILAELPKENSTLRMGLKQLGNQIKKRLTIYNVNIPCITMSKEAYRLPIKNQHNMIVKPSKLIGSWTITVLVNSGGSLSMFSTEDDENIIDSTITFDIFGALQKIKIRPSCDHIENNDHIFVKQEDGWIILSKKMDTQEQVLAKVCTATLRMHLS